MTGMKFILLICVLITLNGCTTSNNAKLQSQTNPTFYQSENKEKSILSIKSRLERLLKLGIRLNATRDFMEGVDFIYLNI